MPGDACLNYMDQANLRAMKQQRADLTDQANLRAKKPGKAKRVSNAALGGGTQKIFLAKFLTIKELHVGQKDAVVSNFDEMLVLAYHGSPMARGRLTIAPCKNYLL